MPRKTRTKATPVDINEDENENGRKASNPRSGRKSNLDSEVKTTPTNAGRSRRSSTAAQTAASVADSHTPRRRGRRGSSASSESNAKSREASPQSRSHARRALKQVSYIESDAEDKEEDKLPEEEYNAEEEDLESESGDSSKEKLKTSSPSRRARSTPRSARSSGRRRPTGKGRGKKAVQSPKKKATPSRRSRNSKVESEEEESDKKPAETPTRKRSSRTESKKKGKYTEVLSDEDDEKSSESEKAPPAKKTKSRRNAKAESEEEEPIKNENPVQKRSPRTAAKKKGKYTEPVSDDDEKASESTKRTKRRRATSEDEASNNEEEKPTSTRASRAVNRSSENRPVAAGRRAIRGRNKNNSVDEEINDDSKKDKKKRPLSDNDEEESKAKRSKNDAKKKLDLEDDENLQEEGLELEIEKMDESDDKPKTENKVAITDCSVKISLLKNYDRPEDKDDNEANENKSEEGELSPGKKEGDDGDLSSQEEEEDKSSTKKKEEDEDEEEDDSTSEKIQENDDSSPGKKDGSSPRGYNGDSSPGQKEEGDDSTSGKKEQGDESTSDGKKEDESCPEMKEMDESCAEKKEEDKCSPTNKDNDKFPMMIKEEDKLSPMKRDKDKSSPIKKDEDKSSPMKNDEDKSSPMKNEDDKYSPMKKEGDKTTPANTDEDMSSSKQTDPVITPKSKDFQLTTNNNGSVKSTSEVNNVSSLEKSEPMIITPDDDKESKVNREKNENRIDHEPEKETASSKTYTRNTENINNNSGIDNEAHKPQSPSIQSDRQKKILNGLRDAHSSPEFNNIFHGRKFIINQNINDEVWSQCHDRTFGVVCYNLGGEAPRPLENFVSSLKILKSELVCMQGVNEMFHKGYLESTLNGLGYKGIFSLPKGQSLGFSVFFKTTLLKLKNQRMVSLKDLISKELENLLLPNELVSVLQQLRTCGDVFLSSFELSLPGNQATNLVLANISVPRSDLSTHALQIACLAREALGFLENPSNPLIICGGFNMTSTDPSYQLLKDGYLSNDMIETLQTKKDIIKVPGKEDNTALIKLLWKSFQHSAKGLKSCYSAVYEKEVVSPASSEMIWFSSSSLHTLNILEALPESKAPENSLNFNKHIMLKATLSLTS